MELSAHRKNALPPRKRQPSWHRPVGLVSLLAGVAIALSGCAVPRLSADEVLDGPQTAEARSAAITRVEQWPLGLIASGTTLVASQVYIECTVGQNNWKMHQGFRLQCRAHSLNYLGWDHDFASGMRAAITAIQGQCTSDDLSTSHYSQPGRTFAALGPSFDCPGSLALRSRVQEGGADSLLVNGNSWGETFDGQRWIESPTEPELLSRLQSRQWILAVDAVSTFFKDQP